MADRPEWFAAKRYGCGSGLPMSWQGWLVMLGYMALAIGSAHFFADKPLVLASILVPATALMLIICIKTTRPIESQFSR